MYSLPPNLGYLRDRQGVFRQVNGGRGEPRDDVWDSFDISLGSVRTADGLPLERCDDSFFGAGSAPWRERCRGTGSRPSVRRKSARNKDPLRRATGDASEPGPGVGRGGLSPTSTTAAFGLAANALMAIPFIIIVAPVAGLDQLGDPPEGHAEASR